MRLSHGIAVIAKLKHEILFAHPSIKHRESRSTRADKAQCDIGPNSWRSVTNGSIGRRTATTSDMN
jgi:hypothetical protein